MKVAYISHSLVDNRQERFADALRTELDVRLDGSLFEVYPKRWANLTRTDGYAVKGANPRLFNFEEDAWRDLEAYDPDLVLLQDEPDAFVSTVTRTWCRKRDTPYVIFTWENRRRFQGKAVDVLEDAAHVVAGNRDAQTLLEDHPTDVGPIRILPQVGVDVNHFTPDASIEPRWDVYVTGRPDDPMKAVDDAVEATRDRDWSVVTRRHLPHVPHDALVERYNAARVVARPSKDIPGRPREQFLPASSAEAIACGTPVVTSDQDAIWYWGAERWTDQGEEACPAILHHEEDNVRELESYLDDVLGMEALDREALGREGREWLVDRLSNEVVAEDYVSLFEGVVS